VYCWPIWLLAGIVSARVVAHFMDVGLVGVPAFTLVFAFGLVSMFGWAFELVFVLMFGCCSWLVFGSLVT